MNLNQNSKLSSKAARIANKNLLQPWLEILAIIAWGILLLKFWVTGQLKLLIHPDYFWMIVVTGVALLFIGALKAWERLAQQLDRTSGGNRFPTTGHITLIPPSWSTMLLLLVGIAGLLITPKVFASQTAIQRGVTDSITMTRSKPQAFRTSTQPEKRSLVDWVRTLNVYPEPDAYTGQKVKVQGFVVHPPDLPEQYLLISRFVITCCAADAYPVGLPVNLIKLNKVRTSFAPDNWFDVEGKMITEILKGKRQLTIEANSLTPISAPENPYDY